VLTGDRTDNIIGLKGIGPKKAEKLLKDCKTEREYYDACLKAYDGNQLRVDENLNLLWLRREPNQVCPYLSISWDATGQ
jgi:5'-3' exonuclease